MNSYKSEMLVSGDWCGNALRFATEIEADRYGADLFSRWTMPSDFRAVPSDDAVTHRWNDSGLAPVDAPEGSERIPARRVSL